MARFTQEKLAVAVQPFLEPGEQILNCAYGMQQPGIGFVLLTGLIGQALFTKYYVAALTNRRFLLLHCTGKLRVREIVEYRPGAIPPLDVKHGAIFAVMTIDDPHGAMKIKFHRSVVANNREQAEAIGNAINGRQAA